MFFLLIVACKQGHESKSWGGTELHYSLFSEGASVVPQGVIHQMFLFWWRRRRRGHSANAAEFQAGLVTKRGDGNANRKLKDHSKCVAAGEFPPRLQKAAFICIINLKLTRHVPPQQICSNRLKKEGKTPPTATIFPGQRPQHRARGYKSNLLTLKLEFCLSSTYQHCIEAEMNGSKLSKLRPPTCYEHWMATWFN